MSEHSQEDLESSLAQLSEKLPALISIQNMFWKSTPQFKALLSEDGVPNGVKTTSAARRFTSPNITYLRLIYIYGDNPEKIARDLTVVIKPAGGDAFQAQIYSNKTYAYIWVRQFCEWFELSSTSLLLKPQIKKIEIHGATQEQLSSYAKDIEETVELKRTIDQYKTKTTDEYEEISASIHASKSMEKELQDTIKNLSSERDELQNEIDTAIDKKIEINSKLKDAEIELKLTHNKMTEAKNNTEQLTQQAENLNKSIANLQTQLEKLTNDRNLISDEYGPYVEEGYSQAKIYSGLTLIPLLAILFSSYQVYVGASKLLSNLYPSTTDILSAFLLRVPFAVIFGMAILYSWKLANALLQRIFKIHGDRLTLARLLVVARETVHSSTKNLNISDHEKFQEQTALKIEVLKSHLARDLNENFSYQPVPLQKTAPLIPATEPKVELEIKDDGFETKASKTA